MVRPTFVYGLNLIVLIRLHAAGFSAGDREKCIRPDQRHIELLKAQKPAGKL
jgi:hypothetical protein